MVRKGCGVALAKALILSDTHGLVEEVKQVVERVGADTVFHCGDIEVDAHADPFLDMKLVRGNNDFDIKIPNDLHYVWQGIPILMTHGHLYGVNYSLLRLKYRAEAAQVRLVLFGHTHYPLSEEEDSLIFINPGSLRQPRGYAYPTYVVLEVEEVERQKLLHVQYYRPNGESVASLQRSYTL